MKKVFRNFLILIIPIALMILINETVRLRNNQDYRSHENFITINSNKLSLNYCSWACHDNTSYCRNNHVKLNKLALKYSDVAYNQTIKFLKESNRSYEVDNLIYLVFGIPLFIYFFLIKCINNFIRIKDLK
jgi:hypothetical protein